MSASSPHTVTLDQIVEWNKTREVRSMRSRDLKKLVIPWSQRKVLFTCSNGWTIEQVFKVDFPIEGWLMGHCLGDPRHNRYYTDREFKSLRDPHGVSHVTIQGGHCIGRADRAVRPEYLELVKEYIPGAFTRGKEVDDNAAFHESGKWNDEDYRDNGAFYYYRGDRWKAKRGVAV